MFLFCLSTKDAIKLTKLSVQQFINGGDSVFLASTVEGFTKASHSVPSPSQLLFSSQPIFIGLFTLFSSESCFYFPRILRTSVYRLHSNFPENCSYGCPQNSFCDFWKRKCKIGCCAGVFLLFLVSQNCFGLSKLTENCQKFYKKVTSAL